MFKNQFIHAWLALAIFSHSAIAFADSPIEGTKPAHCRATWTSDPATTTTISWSTAEIGKTHSVQYWVKGETKPQGVRVAESGRFTGGEVELYYHHVRLTDLKPSTAYEVQIQSDNEKSSKYYFVTAPNKDRNFSMLHGGDSRSDSKARRKVNTMMARLIHESYENDEEADDILALAHGGDYIVSGPNMKQWTQWLTDHELTTNKDGRLLPVIPARGNHDRGKPFNQVFGFPDGDLNYYAINLGPQVRFVTLNSETSTAGDQKKWLIEELNSSRPKHRWLVAQYHRPAYPAVKRPASTLKSWVPEFETYNVDLVCESDGHTIKRTVPIRNNKPDPTGVVYIGEGGLGVPQRTPKTDRWFLKSPGMADRGNHVFLLTFTEDKLLGKCVLDSGKIRDEFSRPVRK